MSTLPLRPAEQPLPVTVETIDVLLELLTEAERKLAKIALALSGDEEAGGMTSVPDTQPAQTDDKATGYPETWKFAEHGDLVAGTFVRFDEGPTRDYGMRVILVLDVDGAERSIWLSQTALFNKVRDELNRRTSKTLEPGERVVIQRHEKTTSENGRSVLAVRCQLPRPAGEVDN